MLRRCAAALLIAGILTACGAEAPERAPAKVAVELVPTGLLNNALVVSEDTKTNGVFTTPVPRGLVADGRVFTIRGAADRLVGTLQLSTVKNQVNLADPAERSRLLNGILTSSEVISVGGVEVAESSTQDKTVYVWFGDRLFHVLQLKPNKAVPFEPEKLLTELIGYEKRQPAWRPVTGPGGPDVAGGEEEDPG